MKPIPDFTDPERRAVEAALITRYGRIVPLESADVELRLDPAHEDLTDCPALYWCERGASFVVCKLGAGRYRAQFFYGEHEQYGTGREEYDSLEQCVTTLLQVQADHEASNAGRLMSPNAGRQGAEYSGPIVI